MIQNIICFIIVLAAFIYLLRYYFVRSKKKQCGGCNDCSASSQRTEKPSIISIPLSALKRRKK